MCPAKGSLRARCLALGLFCLGAAAVWTLLVLTVDVDAIGPLGSSVGFAALNGAVHRCLGVSMPLYVATDLVSLVAILPIAGFAALGLSQWIRRRSLLRVDLDLLALGGLYLALFGVYAVFETFPVNFRPVLIDGALEASYPSSTTLLAVGVMATAGMQCRRRMRGAWRLAALIFTYAVLAFLTVGRVLSGVHWITDIIGGGLFGAGLVALYGSFAFGKRPTP